MGNCPEPVSVFIPHHGNPTLLEPLFTSLFAMGMESERVEYVLVDNGSTDGSVEFVRKRFPKVRVLSLGRNEGFAPALNRAAHAYDSEWLCFLNNDVRVDINWLPNLLYASNSIHATCFASHILDWSGKKTHFGGGWINLFGKGFESPRIESPVPYEIFFACGCGMMIRRDLFLELEGFDDDYFMLYEDVDLGWRLRLLGHSIYMVPDAKVMHKGHTSLNQVPYTQKALFFERNSLATIYKNLASDSLAVVFPLALREALARAQALSGIGIPFPCHQDGLAILESVNAFYSQLPRWKEKRRWIQQRRTLTDTELFARFFPHPSQLWAFCDDHYRRIHHPHILPVLQGILDRARWAVGFGE